MLSFDFPAFDGPLVPPADHWPVFDDVLWCAFSASPASSASELSPSPSVASDPLPSPATLAHMPIPPPRASPRNKNPDHIPRPRNAFMLFRSAFSATQRISARIEHDNRHITRIIAHCWHRLSDAEKQVWRDKAAAEKAQHTQRYPNYRFSPICRANKPVKRNVRRNGVQDVKRCEKLAELLMAGKYGKELETAVNKFDHERRSADQPVDVSDKHPVAQGSEPVDVPPFRSPLLPPTTSASRQAPDENLTPECPVRVAPARHVEPQTLFSDTDEHMNDFRSLLESPSHPPPRSPTPDRYRSIVCFVQNSHAELEQPVPDFFPFTWSQSDSFSYYD